ncbi:hypothetical protein [Pseudomonas phage LUZ7]|uniref:Uncharacterized protein n=1 Tax=Pseudomonas phage LUZ7 TaxID=655097 RepID=C8ZKL4_9CAUD|nr:hypothetical protein PP-LUZ7_gp115 [Pseudomonas phage LUZ7]CAZ66256.1 hypothetical protein [Pseudomonas phage LUZ7]
MSTCLNMCEGRHFAVGKITSQTYACSTSVTASQNLVLPPGGVSRLSFPRLLTSAGLRPWSG